MTSAAHDTIEPYMTPSVHTIGSTRTFADAHELMRRHRIRHLPVLNGGRLVGMVTERDLALVETLKGVEPGTVLIEDGMSSEVFSVEPTAPLASVAKAMSVNRFGSAVVVHDGKVVGIFTAVDALRLLAERVAG